jgi:glycosyltransferase involved in cell wall biosynthesis
MLRLSLTPEPGEAHQPNASPLRVLSVAHGGVHHGVGRMRYEALSCQAGLDLTLVVPERWHEYGVTYHAEPQAGDIKVVVAPIRWLDAGPAKWYLHHYKSLGQILRQARPDVIHLWEEPWSVVALQALRLRDRLLPAAALMLETEQNILRRLPPPFEQIRRLTLRHTDLLVARQAEAEAVSRACGFTGPARYVRYGVDPAIFYPRPASRSGDGLTLGYVGRIVRDKGIFDVLDALVAGPGDVRFTLVGTGPDRAEFQARVHTLGLSGRVRVTDPQPPHQVAEFMRGLDALLLMSRTTPSWKEQFGRVIIEAQACGTPVIGSSSGAIPEVVGMGGWIIPEGDTAALAGLFARLRHDRATCCGGERDRAAGLGLANVARHYTYRQIGAQLLDAYQTAAAARITSRRARPSSRISYGSAPPAGFESAPHVLAVHETEGRKHFEAAARHHAVAPVSLQWRDVLTGAAAPLHKPFPAPPHEPLAQVRPTRQKFAPSC